MRYKIYIVAVAILVFPQSVFAAYNDVTLNTGTTISVGGIDLAVQSSNAEVAQITANASTLVIRLEPGSSIKIGSASKYVLSHDAASQYVISDECNSSGSSIKFALDSSSSISYLDITVTPSTSTCVGSVTIASSSAGGGGVFSGTVPNTPVARPQIIYPDGTVVYLDEDESPAETLSRETVKPTSVQSVQEPIKLQTALTMTLKKGMENSEVKMLQEMLATDSSIYPEGITSGYFGSLTQRAVERFQKKYKIVSSGTPNTTGYGLVGPSTRAKLSEVFGMAKPKAPEVAKPSIRKRGIYTRS